MGSGGGSSGNSNNNNDNKDKGGGGAMAAMMAMQAISSIGSTYSNAQAIKAAGAYQQSVADTNAKISNLEAKQTLEAGDIAASRKNLETQKVQSSGRAAAAASGVDVSEGSAARVVGSIATQGAFDELTIRNNAARQAWGYKTQALQDTFAGKFSSLTAKSQAGQTLLTGGIKAVEGPTSIYANYERWSRYMGSGSTPTLPKVTNDAAASEAGSF